MKQYFVHILYDDGDCNAKLMYEYEVIKFVNMLDLYDNVVACKVFDISTFGKITPLHYKGWQPNCLIQFCTEEGNIIISGYGEDH